MSQLSIERRALEQQVLTGTAGSGAAVIAGTRPEAKSRPTSQVSRSLARESTSRRLLAAADCAAALLGLFIAVVLVGEGSLTWEALAAAPLMVVVCKAIGLYDRDETLLHKTTLDEVPGLFSGATLVTLLVWLADGTIIPGGLSRGEVFGLWMILFVLLLTLRSVARLLARELTEAERCLFVGDPASAEELLQQLETSPAVNAEMVGWILPNQDRREADEAIASPTLPERIAGAVAERDVDRVILGPSSDRSEELVDSVRRISGPGVRLSVMPDVARVVNSSAELDHVNGITLLGLRRFEISASSRLIKRCLDLVASSVALLVLAPLFALIAIAIKLDTRGSVLFRQRRAGQYGEPFEMLKFRTMVEGADQMKEELRHLNEAEGLFKIALDPRITRVGRTLRRLHLDELPQLFNVVRGQMSLVGPRPLVLDEDRTIVGWHRRRLDLLPGITGPWQALGAARIPVREMVRLDYQYVADWSLWSDIQILLRTVPAVVRRRGL